MNNQLKDKIKQYFALSYKYYITFEDTGVSDMEYDYLCKSLYDNFDSIPEELRRLLDKDLPRAGSGFGISTDTYKEVGVI